MTKKVVKEMNIAEKTIEIVRDRGLTTETLLDYDAAPSPLLFGEDGMMTKTDKSQLLKELKTHLKHKDYTYAHQMESAFVIDKMANICKIRMTGLCSFQDFISVFESFTDTYHQFCDYVFDMYSDNPSVKDSE